LKKRLIAMILTSILLLGVVGCAGQNKTASTTAPKTEQKSVRIGFPGTKAVLNGLEGIAQDQRYFDEELEKIGYKVEYVPFAAAGPAVNEALATKNIDFAAYGDFPGVVIKSKGIGVSPIALTSNYWNVTLAVKAGSPIKSVAKLKGKKVAYTKGTIIHKYLVELLQQNNMTEKDIQSINVSTTDATNTLLSGNVDALVFVDSTIAPLLASGELKEIASTRNDEKLRAQGVMIGRDDFLKDNPKVPSALVKALVRSKDFIAKNPQEALKIWEKSGLTQDSLKLLYGSDTSRYASYFPISFSQSSIDRLNILKQFLLEQKIIQKDVDITAYVNNEYYKAWLAQGLVKEN